MKVHNPKTDGHRPELFEKLATDEESEGVRIVEAGNKVFTVECLPPFGLWRIKPAKGKLPKALEGQFTNSNAAQRAIEIYTNA